MADFQKLDVYRCSLEFLRWLKPLLPLLSRPHGDLADQLLRAGSSISLNIAEGSGRRGKDRAHFHAIAHGSARECLAALDVAEALAVLEVERLREGKELLDRMVSMLSVMSGGAQGRSGTGTGTRTSA